MPAALAEPGAGRATQGNSLLSRMFAPVSIASNSTSRLQQAAVSRNDDSARGLGLCSAPHRPFVGTAATASSALATTYVLDGSQAEQKLPEPVPDLGYPRNLEEHYVIGTQIGKGGNGIVKLVYCKKTSQEFACKSIKKVLPKEASEKKKAGHIESLKREISVLKKLTGNLNIISLEGVYEDDEYVHLVQECCKGGELAAAIQKRHYSERTVASYMRAVMRTLAQCHAHHILHRDIKPENFMLLNDSERAPLRAIDFGLATPYEPEDLPLTNLGLEGTPWFMSPETLSSQVTPAADVWAAGVMAYQLLTGHMPFDDHRNSLNPSLTAIWRSVLTDKLDFNKPYFKGISNEAKDFIARLLDRDPAKRPTAKEALKHPFLVGTSAERSTGKQLQQSVVARIQRFAGSSNFKRNVLQLMAAELLSNPGLAPTEITRNAAGRAQVINPGAAYLEPLYKALRLDQADEIDTQQIAIALKELGFRLNSHEIERLIEQLDPGASGKVTRTAFAASQVDWKALQADHKEAWLALAKRAFASLDHDNDGVLRVNEIVAHLEKALPGSQEIQALVQQTLEEAGQGPNEMGMNFMDFVQMLKVSSVDSLDMYDERLPSVRSMSVNTLNALLHQTMSLGSNMDSLRGGNLARAANDDSNHSSSTLADRTNHSQRGLFDMDMSQHGANGSGHYGWQRNGSANGASNNVTAFRFDVGTGVENAGATAQKPAATFFKFDVAGPGSNAAAVKVPAPSLFRFDVAGPRADATPTTPTQQTSPFKQASAFFKFDVSGPSSHQAQQQQPAAPVWRFDVKTEANVASASMDSPDSKAEQKDKDGSYGSARLAALGGGFYDRRHHGSSLYKNSICRTATADRSLHGGLRPLATVVE